MKQDKISVFVRIRPYQEKQSNSSFILSVNQKAIVVKDKERQKQQDLNFTFDHIFQSASSQTDVYKKIGQPIVEAAFQGINGTIFAYGQTSSGKTYTCIGPNSQDSQFKGILPRCVQSIFQKIKQSPSYLQFRIKISMIQIYMQKIRDLLQPSKNDLKLRQNKAKGIYIQDVTEQYVASSVETLKIFKKGISNRVVAFTNMNDVSSRSHMAFIITVHQNNLKDGSAKSAKITVIDLAGSQKVSKTQAQGKVLDEAKQINKSLSSLGNVINSLTDPKIQHVPYRDSKLTRLLQQSLGGNSKTSLIINISPSNYNSSESISSLRFGYRAKQIKNKPRVNKQYTIGQLLVLLQKSQKRNQELELLLKEMTQTNKKSKQKSMIFVQNLLDSDNPLMSAVSDNQTDEFIKNKSALKTIKKCYQSQIGSQGEQQFDKPKLSKISQKQSQYNDISLKLTQKQQQLKVISDELIRVNNQRIDLTRQLDICTQKLQLTTREARLSMMKLNAQKRQGENMLQKYIKQNIQKQQKLQIINKLQSKIRDMQQSFKKLSSLNEEQYKKKQMFGLNKDSNIQYSRIIKQVLNKSEQKYQHRTIAQESLKKDEIINQLQNKNRQLQQSISIFSHLENVKQEFIKQKLRFNDERMRVYKDLENRIQKVLELQEKLDQEKEKRQNYQKIIQMDEDEKSRKIKLLQQHVHELSQNYYVLKGQQSSWFNNNKKQENKLQMLQMRVKMLQSEKIQLRVQLQNLQMKVEQFESLHDNASVLDMELNSLEDNDQQRRGNIVKIVKSHIYYE